MSNINKAYTWAIQTCNAPNVGYSQSYRNQQTVGGITYYDCSSFINYALIDGGFETPSYAPRYNAFTTYTMPAELIRLGFTEVDASGILLPGDIGLSSTHTEMCYKTGTQAGYGIFMGAHTSNAALQNQVSIGSSSGDAKYERSFPRIFRYGSGGATGYGYSIYVVAALCGNAWRESNINPSLEEVGGGGFGIFQWTGTRRDSLESYLSDMGLPNNSPDGQLMYLIHEDFWSGEYQGISSLQEFLTSTSTDIAMLTTAFMECWEIPGVPELEERIQHANQCYTYILEHADDESITTWVNENRYLTESEILNNAVLLYRFYSAGGGGGGFPTGKRSRMPVWMYSTRRFRY